MDILLRGNKQTEIQTKIQTQTQNQTQTEIQTETQTEIQTETGDKSSAQGLIPSDTSIWRRMRAPPFFLEPQQPRKRMFGGKMR